MAQQTVRRSPSLQAPARAARRAAAAPANGLDDLGRQLFFYARALGYSYKTVVRYKKEIVRLVGEISFGTGALIAVAGTIGVSVVLTVFTGFEVTLQGTEGLTQVGAQAFAGFVGAFFDTRDIGPLVIAEALTATIGAGFTAQLGAQRINEEIDALEVMAVPSIPFLVTTRIIAGLVAIIPIYTAALIAQYFASRTVVIYYYGQASGTYDHYFNLFLPPIDIFYSYLKVIIFVAIIMLICTYYGYNAGGGPAGVGVAVGRAVRASIVLVGVVDLLLTAVFFGTASTISLSG